MKPLGPSINNTVQSCNDVTSTCVMWDGPNISFDCLGVQICKGESINPIVYRSFVNLCNLLEALNLDSINVTCLGNLIDTKRSLSDMFNIISDNLCIENDKIIKLEDTIEKLYNANLPFCLQNFNDQLTITKLPLPEYYQKVAAQICFYLIDIANLQDQYASFASELILLENAIIALCGATTVKVTPICTNNPVENPLNDPVVVSTALIWLEQAFCAFQSYTGTNPELLAAVAKDCPDLGNAQRISLTGLMKDIPGWIDTPTNISQSINNLWLTICDMRSGLVKVQSGCCPP